MGYAAFYVDSGDTAPGLSDAVIADGKRHRIGLVWNGLQRTLYVDGFPAAEGTQDGLKGSSNGLYIGAGKTTAPGTCFSGLLDEVRIYNRALNP